MGLSHAETIGQVVDLVCRLWWGQMMFAFVIYLVGFVEIIQSGEDITSDGLSWVGIELLVHSGVG